ncbi:MAG: type II secretion system protein [Myxococcaceae bacterium]|jgi:type II secretory pathway pseudopilin PulG|nr:type II secretion system protein [Myxococcaceae bacterium]MCA3013120.1 type II secretion system protein [Myxococcaceae bacterium]
MRRAGARGYTLLEFGIVLGVIGVLLGTAVVSMQGMFSVARSSRTGDELWGLATAAGHALSRGRRINPVSRAVSFEPGAGLAPVVLGPTTPLCYDLSQVEGRTSTCRESASPATWGGGRAALRTPSGASVLTFVGGGGGYGNGYNPSCMPYVVCFYPARVDVMTCVPEDDVGSAGLESTITCGPCSTLSPITNERTVCVSASRPALSGASTASAKSYQPAEFNRTIPGLFNPKLVASE